MDVADHALQPERDCPMPTKNSALSIELVMAHFGNLAFTLEPALSTFKNHIPEARVVLYTDADVSVVPGVDEIRRVTPIFDPEHHRYGWHCSDYYRVVGMLESKADVAIYTDSDMYYCSEEVRALPELTRRFHFCIPQNSRILARWDTLIGADSDRVVDPVGGYCFAYNTSPLAFYTRSGEARAFLEDYLEAFGAKPGRSPLAFHRSVMRTGFSPFVLPVQWCVCEEHIGIGDEVILHVGHRRVHTYYLGTSPQWLKEVRRLGFMIKKMYFPGKKTKKIVTHWKPS